MKLSNEMRAFADKRIKPPAVWTIIKDKANKVELLEAENETLQEKLNNVVDEFRQFIGEGSLTEQWLDALLGERDVT